MTSGEVIDDFREVMDDFREVIDDFGKGIDDFGKGIDPFRRLGGALTSVRKQDILTSVAHRPPAERGGRD